MASTATDDLIHCTICLEVFCKPRALPCLHTFCEVCLQEYINATARSGPIKYGFECPLCRKHTLPAGEAAQNSRHEDWASHFPINHIIISLLDAREKCGSVEQKVNYQLNSDPVKPASDSKDFVKGYDNRASPVGYNDSMKETSSGDKSFQEDDEVSPKGEVLEQNYPEFDERPHLGVRPRFCGRPPFHRPWGPPPPHHSRPPHHGPWGPPPPHHSRPPHHDPWGPPPPHHLGPPHHGPRGPPPPHHPGPPHHGPWGPPPPRPGFGHHGHDEGSCHRGPHRGRHHGARHRGPCSGRHRPP